MALDIGRKGQVSIEFILIVTIALFYITTVVWPIVNDSTTASEDVQGISATKISAMKIANALNEAESSNGDMKKTISILLPLNAVIESPDPDELPNLDTIRFTAFVDAAGGNPDGINCVSGETTGPPDDILLNYKCTSTIDLITGAGTTFSITGPIFKDFVVKKEFEIVSAGWA